MTVNLNSQCLVQLTQSGHIFLQNYYNDKYGIGDPKALESLTNNIVMKRGKTYNRFALWELMAIYGNMLNTTQEDLPFVGNVIEFIS
ncbi:hypothetical protein D3C71_1083280 [compost metagenome]